MTLKQYKNRCRHIARQLGYVDVMPNVIERINNAQTEAELIRIMITCRNY